MHRKIMVLSLAFVLALSVAVQAQGVEEGGAMLRAFLRENVAAQGFEVTYQVKKSPSAAVPFLQKGEQAKQTLPYGSFSTIEERDSTTLILRCRVAPEKSIAREALARMRRTLGAGGETTAVLYGMPSEQMADAEQTLRALFDALNESVRRTQERDGTLTLTGAAYQAAAYTQDGRMRIAIARPRFGNDKSKEGT